MLSALAGESATSTNPVRTIVVGVVLLALIVGALVVFQRLKPRIKQSRYDRWREAGLLPDQLDPHTPADPDREQRVRDARKIFPSLLPDPGPDPKNEAANDSERREGSDRRD